MASEKADALLPLRHSAAHIMAQAVLELFPDAGTSQALIDVGTCVNCCVGLGGATCRFT